MKTIFNHLVIKWVYALVIIGCLLCTIACDEYLETEDPIGQINADLVFEDEALATAAVTTLYAKLRDEVIVTGDFYGMGALMGFYADELDFYGFPGTPLEGFYSHQILAANTVVKSTWNGAYNLIYMSNTILEGLQASNALSEETIRQLSGEALFIRAMTHFYLANLFGDVPYIKTTDYLVNKDVSRDGTDIVYENILNDLELSKGLLPESYLTGERTRANKLVVHAFRARVYLYMGDWQKAEEESSILINNPVFLLEPDPSNEFLKESSSAILQLKPANAGDNTHEGMVFNFNSGPPFTLALSNSLVNSMEENDLRKEHWIAAINNGTDTWYASTKYKYRHNTGSSMEYSIVLRLAEQYLLRAEARINLGDIQGAKDDINAIRSRAGLPHTSVSSPEELMEMVMHERRIELFAEQGHRWFDLKRTELAGEILSPVKPAWNQTHILLPLPESELLINPNLNPQNPGY